MDALIYLLQSIGGGFAGAGFVGAIWPSHDPSTRKLAAMICVVGVAVLFLVAFLGGPVGL